MSSSIQTFPKQTFPKELSIKICFFLNPADSYNVGSSCKTFHDIINIITERHHEKISKTIVSTYKILKLEVPNTEDLLKSFNLRTMDRTLLKISSKFLETFIANPKKCAKFETLALPTYITRPLETSEQVIRALKSPDTDALEMLSNELARNNRTDEALQVALKFPIRRMEDRVSRNRAVDFIAKVLNEEGRNKEAMSVAFNRLFVRSYHASNDLNSLDAISFENI